MWLQPKLLGRRCRGEMKNKRNNYHFPHWPPISLAKYKPVQALSKNPERCLPQKHCCPQLGFWLNWAS